jgi:Chalcone isomerase-like
MTPLTVASNRDWILPSLLALLLGGCVHSKPESDSFPPTISVQGKTLKLNGTGLRKKLIFDVYTAALYVENKSNKPLELIESKELRVLQLKYHRDIETQKAIDAFKEGFPKNCAKNCESLRPILEKFDASILNESPVTKGQVKTYFITTDYLSADVKGGKNSTSPISAPYAGQEFLRVFLGNFPPSETLKNGLSGIE